MKGTPGRVTLAALGLLILLTEGHLVFIRQVGVPSVSWGPEPFVAGEIAGDLAVAQTFVVRAAGLHRIIVWPQATGPVARGDVTFALRDISETDDGPVVVRQRVPASLVLQASSYAIDFAPLALSFGRRYRLEISMPETPSGQGLGVRAVRGRRYRDGALSIHGQAQWADMLFRTSATRATAFARLAHQLKASQRLPGPTLLLVLWVLAHGALALVVVQLLRADIRP